MATELRCQQPLWGGIPQQQYELFHHFIVGPLSKSGSCDDILCNHRHDTYIEAPSASEQACWSNDQHVML